MLPKDFIKTASALGVDNNQLANVHETSTHTMAALCGRLGKKISQYGNVRADRLAIYRSELESNIRDLQRMCTTIRTEIDRILPDRTEDERRDLTGAICRRMVRGVASTRLRQFIEEQSLVPSSISSSSIIDGLLADRKDKGKNKPIQALPKPEPKLPIKNENEIISSQDMIPTEEVCDTPLKLATDEIETKKDENNDEERTETEIEPDPAVAAHERAYLAAEEFVRAMDAAKLETDRSIDEATRACGEAYRAIVDVLDGKQVTRSIRAPAVLVPTLINDRLYATAAAVLRGHCMSLVTMNNDGTEFDDAYEQAQIRPLQFYAALSGRQLPGDASAPTETGVRFDSLIEENEADSAVVMVDDLDATSPDLWLARVGYTAIPLASATDEELNALKFESRDPPFPESEPSSIGFTALDITKGCREADPQKCFGWLYKDSESGNPAGAVLMRRGRFSAPIPNEKASNDLPYALPPWNNPEHVDTLEILRFPVIYAGDTWLERCMIVHATQAAQAKAKDEEETNPDFETDQEVQAWCARLPITRIPSKSTYVIDTRRAAFWHKYFKMSRCFPFDRFDDSSFAGLYFSQSLPSIYGDDSDADESPTMLRPMPSKRQLASFARAVIADQPEPEPEPEPKLENENDYHYATNPIQVQPSKQSQIQTFPEETSQEHQLQEQQSQEQTSQEQQSQEQTSQELQQKPTETNETPMKTDDHSDNAEQSQESEQIPEPDLPKPDDESSSVKSDSTDPSKL